MAASRGAVDHRQYDCGYCGLAVASEEGDYYPALVDGGENYHRDQSGCAPTQEVRICPKCQKVTFFHYGNGAKKTQTPAPLLGAAIEHLPDAVNALYLEAKHCFQAGAYTATAHVCRKLLMNVAHACGAVAVDLQSFHASVSYLDREGYIPKTGRPWVDEIRKIGNVAAHEIPQISAEQATKAMRFTEMMLRNVYEMPGTLGAP